MLEILGDPDDDEHAEMLEWLGLESAADFDPVTFDSAAVEAGLAWRAKVLVPS